MASKSNTEPSLRKKTCNVLGQWPQKYPIPLSVATCNLNTVTRSCLYVQPKLLNKYPFKPSAPKPSFIESVNKQLQDLLKQKLAYLIFKGRPTDTFEFHCTQLMSEIMTWIRHDPQDPIDTYDSRYRDKLLTLFSSSCKQSMKNIPLDESEWLKLLNQWIRHNSHGDIVFSRDVYEIFAVDGFYGFQPKDLKLYLPYILGVLTPDFKKHIHGVRAMYDSIGQTSEIASLTGTDSACIVLLSLLHFYEKLLKNELMDHPLHLQVVESKSWAEGFLHKQSQYYRDIKHVNHKLLETLVYDYSKHFTDESEMQHVGRELLKQLSVLEKL